MEIDFNPVVREQTEHGPQLHVLGGRFEFGDTAIPFFTAHMTISQVANFLKTPSELAAWTDEGTDLEGLYQRSIDYNRVRSSILPYLTRTAGGRPRFFNALTIALVPCRGAQIVEFDGGSFAPPGMPEKTGAKERLDVGPVSLAFYMPFDENVPETYSLGEICWNTSQTACVAVDGQHRLYALKMFHRLKPDESRATRIAVIFVMPSTKLGFRVGHEHHPTVLKLLRSIFIDLNKHAKPVKRSRLILLDDTDPHSLLVRRAVAERLEGVGALPIISASHRLPLSLVDWHSDEAKFDQGPYITSILMLDRVVQTLLDCRAVMDWSNGSAVARQHKAFQLFGYKPTEQCKEALEKLQEAEEAWQSPFAYPEQDRAAILQTVGSELASHIFNVLTGVQAYDRVLTLRHDNSMTTADFSSWYERFGSSDRTPDAARDLSIVEEHIRSRPQPPNIEIWKSIVQEELPELKGDSLLFKVVFQDAIFRALQQLWRQDLLVVDEGEYPAKNTEAHRVFWTSLLIRTINDLEKAEPGIWDLRFKFEVPDGSDVSFWHGSVLKVSDGTVDFTNGAMHRASNLLLFAALLKHARESLGEDRWDADDVDTLMSLLRDFDEGFVSSLESVIKRLVVGAGNNPGPMRRIVIERSPDLDEEDEKEFRRQVDVELNERAKLLISLLQ